MAKAAQRIGSYLEVSPGVDIDHEDEGDGPTLILVPGRAFTTRAFEDSSRDGRDLALESGYRFVHVTI